MVLLGPTAEIFALQELNAMLGAEPGKRSSAVMEHKDKRMVQEAQGKHSDGQSPPQLYRNGWPSPVKTAVPNTYQGVFQFHAGESECKKYHLMCVTRLASHSFIAVARLIEVAFRHCFCAQPIERPCRQRNPWIGAR